MLGFMRKHARSTLIKVAFWMIIVVFVFWGVGVMVSGRDHVNVAAMVDGEPITAQAYQRAYENMHRFYQQLYRENFKPEVVAQLNLHQRALDDLILDMLLRREAGRLGLGVDDDEVRDAILGMPSFRSDERFDRNRYLAVLRASGLSATEFEESQRQALLVTKLEGLVTDGIAVSEAEIRDRFQLDNEKITVAFAKVPYAKYRDGVTVTDAEIAEHYEQNQDSFREPERVTFAYVEYAPEAFREKVPLTDEGIATYYETHVSDYEVPEKVRLRQILFPLDATADDAARTEVRAKAEGVLAEAQGGADFAALARKHGDMAGEPGLVEPDTLDAAVAGAIEGLEPGQLSGLVETAGGFAVVKLEGRQPRAPRPLAEVREEIARTLRENGADDTTRAALTADLARAREGAPIEELAAARGLAAVTSPSVSRGEPVAGVKGPALVLSALALDVGAVDEIVGVEPPYYLLKVTAKSPSLIKPLDEVRDEIREALRTAKARDAARIEAEALRAAAAETGGLAGLTAAARAKGHPMDEAGPIGRGQFVDKISTVPREDLFALTPDAALAERVYDLPGAAAVIALKERVPADEAGLAEKRDGLRDAALARKRSQLLEAFRDMLRRRADIRVNPDIVTAART
jgi:peptidyl-prolyl cis-trans isomerase D